MRAGTVGGADFLGPLSGTPSVRSAQAGGAKPQTCNDFRDGAVGARHGLRKRHFERRLHPENPAT